MEPLYPAVTGLSFAATPPGLITDEDAAVLQRDLPSLQAVPDDCNLAAGKLNEYNAFRSIYPRPLSDEESKARTAQYLRLESIYDDFDKATQGQEFETLKFSPPEEQGAEKISLSAQAFAQFQTGQTWEGPEWEANRDALADKLFEGRGKGSDGAFHGEAKKWLGAEKEKRARAQGFHEAGQRDAMTLSPEDPVQRSARLAEIYKLDTEAPGERDKLAETYRQQRLKAEVVAAPLRPVAREIEGLMKATQTERFGEKGQAALEQAIDRLAALPPEQRGIVVGMLKDQAAPEQNDNTLEKSASQGIRSLTGMLRGAVSNFNRNDLMVLKGKAERGDLDIVDGLPVEDVFRNSKNYPLTEQFGGILPGMRKATEAERQQISAMADKQLARMEVANQAIGILEGTVDPIGASGLLQEFSVEFGGMLGAMAPIIVPYAGVALAQGAYADQEFHRQRSMGTDAQTAHGLAQVTGTTQAAIERAAFLFNFAPKSVLGQLAGKAQFTSPGLATSAAAQVTGRVALTQGAEYGQEIAQNAVPIFTAGVAESLGMDLPEAASYKAEWERWQMWDPDVFMVMLPLSLMGGGYRGLANTAEARRGQAELLSDPVKMAAAGITPERAAEIAAMMPQERVAAYQEAYKARDPETPEAAAARQAVMDQAKAETAAAAAEQKEAGVQAVRRTGAGWLVDMEDGSSVPVDSTQAAMALVKDLRQANTLAEAEALVSIVDQWQERAPEGDERSTKFTGAVAVGDNSGITYTRGGKETRGELDTASLRNLHEEAAMTAEATGNTDVHVLVNGLNRVEFQERVADGAKQLVRALDAEVNQNASNVLTLVHEQVEAVFTRGALAGTITQQETRAAIQSVAAALDPAALPESDVEGREFRARVQRVAAGQASDTEVRETVSELVVADALGRRKDGKLMPAGSVTAAVEAAVRATSDPTAKTALQKFLAFLRAVKTHFRAVFGTAAALRKARRDGTIKEGAEWESFVDKLLEVDQQRQNDAELADEVAQYIPPTPEQEEAGIAFSLTPAKRDSPAPILDIASQDIGPERSDWRRAVRDYIAERLQGRVIVNDDSGLEIKFTAESKAEAPSKLRRNTGFQAARRIEDITMDALSLGWKQEAKGRTDGTKGFHYFAMPVRVDGQPHTAWFNARMTGEGTYVFYEFGLSARKEARTTQGLGDQVPDPVAPQSGPVPTIGEFLDEVKSSLPAAQGLTGGPAFSVSPIARLDAVMTQLDRALARDPDERRKLGVAASAKLDDLRTRWSTERQTWAGDRIRPLAEPRSKKSLNKEQAFREAVATAEAEEQVWAGLSEEAQAAMGMTSNNTSAYAGPLAQRFSGGRFGTAGRIMPKAEALRSADASGRDMGGEYDGAAGLPPMFFGGTLTPDLAAQEAFERGEISAPDPDVLWEAIRSELQTQAANKEAFAAANTAFKDAQKQARNTAKEAAFEWRRGEDAKQAKDFSPKATLLRDLRTLDAILSVMPPEIRGKVGGFVKLATLSTDKARADEIARRIDKLSELVEGYLRKETTEAMERLLERAKPKGGPGEKPVGKLGADVQSLMTAVEAAMRMTPAQVDGRLVDLDTQLANPDLTPEEEALLMRERELVSLAGAWYPKSALTGKVDKNGKPLAKRIYDGLDAAQMDAALTAVKESFEGGYLEWAGKQLAKRERRTAKREALRGDTGKAGTKQERDTRAEQDMGWIGKVKDFFLGLASFEEVSRYVFGDSITARQLVDEERAASFAYEDARTTMANDVMEHFAAMAGGHLAGEKLRFKLSQKSITAKDGVRLSEMEAIQALLLWQQPDGQRHMMGAMDENGQPAGPWHYDQAWVDSVAAQLTPEGKATMAFIQQVYAKEWGALNPLYRERHGVNLPRHADYAPITVKPQQAKAGEMVDPVTGQASTGSILTPGSLRTRSRSAIAEPDFRDALQTMLAHHAQMEHWKAYYDFAVEAQAVLGNRELGNAVSAAAGKQGETVLRKWIELFAQGGTRDAGAALAANQILSEVSGRAARMALVGRAGTLMIQATQLGAALAEMPTGAYLWRMGKLMTGNLGWGDALRSEYIQRRIAQMPPIVRQAMAGLESTSPNVVKHAVSGLGTLISGADGLFTAGTYAILLDYHRKEAAKQGLTGAGAEAYAHSEAVRNTERVAQPTRMGTRSLFENTTTNPLGKLSWAFASEARQKIALAAWAARDVKKNPARAFRVAMVVWGAGGFMAAAIRNTWRDMRDDDDDEIFDERNWSLPQMIGATMSGPLQGIPGLGEAMQSAIAAATGAYNPGGNLLSGLGRSVPDAKDLLTADFLDAAEPIEDIMRDVEAVLMAAGLMNETAAALASVAHVVRDGVNVLDGLSDDSTEAAAKDKKAKAKAKRDAKKKD